MNKTYIPFNRAAAFAESRDYMLQAFESGKIAGAGQFTQRCQQFLADELGVKKVLLTTSCTHALEMSALLIECGPGDEVIIPSFTFVSVANAFALRGAQPVFADIDPRTLNIDPLEVERLITPRTKAIVLMHYGGIACDMDAFNLLAQRHGLVLIEDNAHGLFGRYKGQALGSFGQFATLSFHETKNFSCGEGGALLINDEQYTDRAEILWEKGTNRRRFLRGEVDKYTWVDVGSSYVLSDLLAAMLWGQFEQAQHIQAKRKHLWETYDTCLAGWAAELGVRQPIIPPGAEQAYHLYYLLLPSPEAQAAFIAHLKEHNILSVFHYQPLHLSEMGVRFGGQPGDCPITEDLAARLVRLPMFYGLTDEDQMRIIKAILVFRAP